MALFRLGAPNICTSCHLWRVFDIFHFSDSCTFSLFFKIVGYLAVFMALLRRQDVNPFLLNERLMRLNTFLFVFLYHYKYQPVCYSVTGSTF